VSEHALDQIGAATNMTRRNGRYPRGRRLLSGNIAKPRPSLRLRPQVTVHCVLDGPLGAESFRPYIEQCVERRAQV
jgi:hypothetical protein